MCADSPHIAKSHANSLKKNDRSKRHIAAFYLALNGCAVPIPPEALHNTLARATE
jgi:hypothetical protein